MDNQSNSLFIICPAGSIESEIRKQYNGNTYFLTSLGGVMRLSDYSFVEEFGEFLKRRDIRRLTIAQDIQCRFLQTIIQGKPGYGTYAEEHFRMLWIDHFFDINSTDNLRKKAARLAKCHINFQLNLIKQHSLLGTIIREQGVLLSGMLVDTKANVTTKKPILLS
nr:hypothetical protein [Cytophagales bacterium]